MLATVTVVGIVVLAVLIWFFLRTRSKDLLVELMEKRKASCRLVSRAEYVEGLHHMPVALAISDQNLYYENSDMQASFELSRIDEIEYDDELTTGRSVPPGTQVLRLRSHGSTFEFVMPGAEIARWKAILPPRRSGGQAAATA
ncbi:MAG TPA: hypothetical protein VF980_19685 [Thermoanaerobaculia bacterium]